MIETECCIVGGGPAGIMLSYLLSGVGIKTTVLEKHHDFFRDFRGDTIHPSTMEVLAELGLLDKFLKLPFQKTTVLEGDIGTEKIILADFSRLKARCPFIAFMPQWDFLNFLAKHAQKFPDFQLLMDTEATDVITDGGIAVGVKARRLGKPVEIRARLVIGADGRRSVVRRTSNLTVRDIGAPIDVLWFRIERKPDDPKVTLGRIDNGRMMVMIERGDYWQCGFVIPKGGIEAIQKQGIAAFREVLVSLEPIFAQRVEKLGSFTDIKLLSVSIDRLVSWAKPGLLCIGDAAHAMSPVGGVGINLAIQDAVAAANILAPSLLTGRVSEADLHLIQKRREFPTKITQFGQMVIQQEVIEKTITHKANRHTHIPMFLKLLSISSQFRRLTARMVGIGVRPEHVSSFIISKLATSD